MFLGCMCALAAAPVPAHGQATVQLQAGGATAVPEAGARADAAMYGLAGVRLDWSGTRGRVFASVLGGAATDDQRGSDFASASAGFETWTGPGTGVGLVARGSGFRVGSPYTYRVLAARAGPALRVRQGRARAALRTEVGFGRTLTELRRDDGRVRRAERDLWTRGAELEAGWEQRRWAFEAAAGSWESAGGSFRRGGAALTVGGAGWAVRIEADRWDTPLGAEWLGGLSVLVPLGSRANLAATGGRVPPDPLTLVDSGDQGGALLTWSLVTFGGPAPPIATVRGTGQARRARFQVEHDRVEQATQVEVIGDFTTWTPVPLRRVGSRWEVEVPVEPGVYHFGFRVDGEWWVPSELPGNVPDEWGRTNATLVVSDDLEEGGS